MGRRARPEAAAAKGDRSRAEPSALQPLQQPPHRPRAVAPSGTRGTERPKWRREVRQQRAVRERACAAAPPGTAAPRARGLGEPALRAGPGFESRCRLPAGRGGLVPFPSAAVLDLFVSVLAACCSSFALARCRCRMFKMPHEL